MQHSNDLQAIAELYRTAKATVGSDVFEECVRTGALATQSRRTGNLGPGRRSSFGLHRKHMITHHSSQLAIAHGEATRGDIVDTYDIVLSSATALEQSVEETLEQVQGVRRGVRLRERERARGSRCDSRFRFSEAAHRRVENGITTVRS